MNDFQRAVAAKKLASVACAAAFLVRERVISEENYPKCLDTWIKKHAEGDAVLHQMSRIVLTYKKVVTDMPDY